MGDSWINDCVAFYIMEIDIVLWGFYFIYFIVIIMGHNWVFKGKNFTILFVYKYSEQFSVVWLFGSNTK